MPRTTVHLRSLTAAVVAAASMLVALAATDATAVATASDCTVSAYETPFAPWNDHARYVRVPGGDFDGDSTVWTLTGGAGLRAADDPDSVATGHTRFLALPAGSSATSPEMCIGLEYPTLRFFARTTRPSSDARLAVHVNFRTPDGVSRQLRIAELEAGQTWQPTRVIFIVANLLALHPSWDGQVAFRFTPTGTDAGWSIDDIYVDPYER
jgi:hypothetical protein